MIIPAYNEAENILQVVAELQQALPQADYCIIDDGSDDATHALLRQHGLFHLHLCNNLGIGGAVQTGYLYALQQGYEVAVQLDGDGQHDPMQIGDLLSVLEADAADLVIGSRFLYRQTDTTASGYRSSSARRLGISVISGVIASMSGQKITDPTSGFRAVNKKLIAHYAEHYAQDYPEPEAIMSAALLGCRICEIPVIMRERHSGVSSISPIGSVFYMFKVVTALVLQRLLLT